MVSRFRRTLSFPANPSRPSSKSYHVRSISLPCRSHPLISQLQTEIQHLRHWTTSTSTRQSSSSPAAQACEGLVLLKSLHASVDDLLQLPHAQDSLRGRPHWAERLLDDFLLFADVFGVLRDALMDLKEEQLKVQVGVRRMRSNSEAVLGMIMGAYVKARKRMGKEARRAAGEVRTLMASTLLVLVDGNNADDELAMILRDVHDVTVSSTLSILNAIVHASSSSSSSNYSLMMNCGSWKVWNKKKKEKNKSGGDFGGFELEVERRMWGTVVLRKRGGVGIEELRRGVLLGKLEEMEKCIGEMESGSEGVFRSFLRARVSLLNILSQ
ncbi:hypothetical protein Syun_005573 [Stephania yunnanensis]|uniref:Uncharacterized protein n=1 Tax=Stephania yunnanensis TaxID=152371 RepID=A0AAP0L5F4_9MAGN